MGQELSVGENPRVNARLGARSTRLAESKEGKMLQSSDNLNGVRSTSPASNPNSYNPVKTTTAPIEQATIGRTLVIKGEIIGTEALYIDGRIEGKITLTDNRVTIGRNGVVQANITAREVVVMGKVNGNIECTDRVDIRSEGSVTGEVSTVRISVEDGAMLKGGIQVKSDSKQHQDSQKKSENKSSDKSMAAAASA